MRRWFSFLLPFIGLAIFVYILRGTGIGRIADTFKAIEARKLVLLPFFVLFIVVIRGYRWQYLMRLVGIDYSLWRSSVVWCIGFSAAAITPGKVGDALRAFYVARETGKNFGECFLTVFIDRLMDLVTVLLFGLVTAFLFSYYYMKISSIGLIFVSVIGVFALLTLVLHRGSMKKILRPLFSSLFPGKYRDRASLSFNSFYDSLGIYTRKWSGTLSALLLTIAYWIVIFVLAYYIAYVLDIEVPFFYLFIIMPMVTLVELVPISVSGIGTREATVIYFFAIIGIPSAEAVGFSIGYLLGGTYLTSTIGFLFWLRNPVRLGR